MKVEHPIVMTVRLGGGVVRQSALVAAGHSKADIAKLVAGERVARVRRSWLALPDADPFLVAAARSGVVLTCMTQAKRLGLWVLNEDRPHVAAAAHSGAVAVQRDDDAPGSAFRATVHWRTPLVPRAPHELVDSIENTLVNVAACQPFEAALAVWESALNRGLANFLALATLPLPVRARAVLAQASPYSDSGLETIVIPRLRWLNIRILQQIWLYGHRVDFLLGERLVLQIDGGHHVGPQRERDIAHDAQLMLMGYHVIRVGYRQVVDDWPSVQADIMRAVARGFHLDTTSVARGARMR